LAVPRYSLAANLGSREAAPHRAFLTVSTEWSNVGSIPYLVPEFTNHLFLLVNGDRPFVLSDATGAAPHPLATDQLLIPASGHAVSGDAVFEIPDAGVASLELLFLDNDKGNMHVALYGHAPPAARPIAGPVGNGLIETAILGLKEISAIGATPAPAGQTYAVLGITLRGLSPGNLVRTDPTRYTALTDADGYSYRVAQVADLEDEFPAATQLLPLLASRGTLAFLLPAPHSALTLAVNVPGYKALTLAVPNSGPAAHVSKPLVSFEDPDTLTLGVLGQSRTSSIGGNSAGAGKEYLVLDLLFTSKVGDGIEFQTGKQLLLLDGQNQISVDPEALEALPHGLKEETVLPPHGQARYQVVYQVPTGAAHLILRYRGFQSDSKQALP
jgi:hypothetical protein